MGANVGWEKEKKTKKKTFPGCAAVDSWPLASGSRVDSRELGVGSCESGVESRGLDWSLVTGASRWRERLMICICMGGGAGVVCRPGVTYDTARGFKRVRA